MQIVLKMADKAGLCAPISGAVKELVKEGRRIRASGTEPKWTGK
jgi:3-hydroxyisobutyrate dehydrogenase/2-hydroxy-3-oxopropionate reductase